MLKLHFLTPLLIYQEVLSVPGILPIPEHEHHPVILYNKPLGLYMVIVQSSLPQAGDFFCLLSALEVVYPDKHHHRLSALGQLHNFLRIGHIQLAHIQLGLGFVWMSIWQLIYRYWLLILLPLIKEPFQISIRIVSYVLLGPVWFVFITGFLGRGKDQKGQGKDEGQGVHSSLVEVNQAILAW